MRVLVTGAGGQLGSEAVSVLRHLGHETLAPSRAELDIADADAVDSYFSEKRPEAVLHCAAWTAVDLAEDREADCRRVNVDGTMYLTEACRRYRIPILYTSTDYVFDGSGDTPWRTDGPIRPVNAYGRSKADGETVVRSYYMHYIVRISWVFGLNGKNFIKTILGLAKKNGSVRVVSDQFGSPTYVRDLAPLLCDILFSEKYGTYHAHNTGYCCWYDVACEAVRAAGIDAEVVPVSSSEFPTRAVRPSNGRLDTSSLTAAGFPQLPDWRDAVDRFVSEII